MLACVRSLQSVHWTEAIRIERGAAVTLLLLHIVPNILDFKLNT